MIKVHVDVKTTNRYLLPLFCVGFTKNCNNQIQKDLFRSASAGSPNPEEDDGYHDPRDADK